MDLSRVPVAVASETWKGSAIQSVAVVDALHLTGPGPGRGASLNSLPRYGLQPLCFPNRVLYRSS